MAVSSLSVHHRNEAPTLSPSRKKKKKKLAKCLAEDYLSSVEYPYPTALVKDIREGGGMEIQNNTKKGVERPCY